MAYKRRYKQPKGYRDGGAVIADEERVDSPALAPDPVPPPADDGSNHLLQAVEAQRRAEELQRQGVGGPSIRDQIDQLRTTDIFRYRAAMLYHQQALGEGVADNTPEMTQRIVQGIQQEIQHQHNMAAENVKAYAAPLMPPAREPTQIQQAALAEAAGSALPVADPIVPQRQNSLPMTAPVSRAAIDYSGRSVRDSTKIKLSAEERDMAHRSIVDRPDLPRLSDADKEYIYARNKAKLLRMRQSGEYRQTTEQDG